jgi:hypothetical protein
MVRTFVTSFKVSFAQNANILIYFLKKTPFVGKRIPEKLYKQIPVKIIMGIICGIWILLSELFKKFLYFGVMLLLPAYLIAKREARILPEFLHIFFFLSFVLSPLTKGAIFEINDMSAFYMITLMRADARKYYLGEILYRMLKDFIYFLLPLTIIGLIIGYTPLNSIVLILELTAFRLMASALDLYTYEKTGTIFAQKLSFFIPLLLLGFAAAYALPLLGITIDFQFLLFNLFIIVSILALGALSFIYLWRYKKYTPIAKLMLNRLSLVGLEISEADMNFELVKLNENKMSKEDLRTEIFDKKLGYEYLNSLFFLRHRRIIISPIKMRIAIIGIAFIIGMFLVLFFPNTRNAILLIIERITPAMVFIMYTLSTAGTICKAMFYNCDSSLLRYSYYREDKVILANFTSRLKTTVSLNIIPAIILSLAIALVAVASGASSRLISLIPLFLCILCLSCFFSIHHLFMYYVLQPYTAELTVKGSLFNFINVVVYLISYFCIRIKTSSYYFTLGILIITIIYIAVALILIYKLAPRTFKLK